MKWSLAALAVGIGLGVIGTSEAAQSAGARVLGAFASHRTVERYEISVGISAGGAAVRPKSESELRQAVVVPAHYGEALAVTSAQDAAVVWYKDAEGVLRNVVVGDPAGCLYRLEQRPATRLEVELLR